MSPRLRTRTSLIFRPQHTHRADQRAGRDLDWNERHDQSSQTAVKKITPYHNLNLPPQETKETVLAVRLALIFHSNTYNKLSLLSPPAAILSPSRACLPQPFTVLEKHPTSGLVTFARRRIFTHPVGIDPSLPRLLYYIDV